MDLYGEDKLGACVMCLSGVWVQWSTTAKKRNDLTSRTTGPQSKNGGTDDTLPLVKR